MGSWFKKKRNIVGAVVGAVIAVVATIAIIVAVTRHEEPGLLQVCEHAGVILYADRDAVDIVGRSESEEEAYGSCERTEELVWPQSQIPLTVAAVTADDVEIPPGDSRREALDSAIRDINQQLGFTLFTAVSERTTAAVLVRSGIPVESSAGEGQRRNTVLGYAAHSRRPDLSGAETALHCSVGLFASVNGLRYEFLVSRHELLHCAGLGHDHDNPASAIYPFTYDDTMWEQMGTTFITDHDKGLLRERYDR